MASQPTGTRRRRPLRNGSSELPTIPAAPESPPLEPQTSNSLLPALDLVNFRSAFGSSLDLAAQAGTPKEEKSDETATHLGDETITLKSLTGVTTENANSFEAPEVRIDASSDAEDEEEQEIRLVGGVAL